MASRADEQKIREWAQRLEQNDPDWWQLVIRRITSMEKCSEFEAKHRAIDRQIARCSIEKCDIPKSLKWRGRDNQHDRECTRCKVLETGGKLRYLGNHCFGTTKVTKCWYEEDIEVCGDAEVPDYLHCWRCEVCGNEFTDDWFLE